MNEYAILTDLAEYEGKTITKAILRPLGAGFEFTDGSVLVLEELGAVLEEMKAGDEAAIERRDRRELARLKAKYEGTESP